MRALRSLLSCVAFVTLGALLALDSLRALRALRTSFALVTLLALWAFRALRPSLALRALLTGFALRPTLALFALRTLRALRAGLALWPLRAVVYDSLRCLALRRNGEKRTVVRLFDGYVRLDHIPGDGSSRRYTNTRRVGVYIYLVWIDFDIHFLPITTHLVAGSKLHKKWPS